VKARDDLRSTLGNESVYLELTGASGTGKSSLLNDVIADLDRHHFQPVYLSSSGTSLTNVARFLAGTVRVRPKFTHLETVQSLIDVLTTQPAKLVVFIDEADRVEARALHELRVLAECHRPGHQLFSVVLSGLRCERLLDEEERYRCQKNLVVLHGADPGSVSGEHLGRLAGHRNWKRQGTWVNVLAATLDGPPLLAPPAPPTSASQRSLSLQAQPRYRRQAQAGGDPSESAREWGWVLGALQSGLDPETVYLRLLGQVSGSPWGRCRTVLPTTYRESPLGTGRASVP